MSEPDLKLIVINDGSTDGTDIWLKKQTDIETLNGNGNLLWAGAINLAIKKVFRELKKKDVNWENKKIKANFVCALSICYLDKVIACVEGKIKGIISSKPKGKKGFGYDPIFIPLKKRKTFGEMKPSQKYKIDHRFQAFKKIRKFL